MLQTSCSLCTSLIFPFNLIALHFARYMYMYNCIICVLSLAVIEENLLIAVNQSYIEKDSEINFEGGEEVAVIPPISGG